MVTKGFKKLRKISPRIKAHVKSKSFIWNTQALNRKQKLKIAKSYREFKRRSRRMSEYSRQLLAKRRLSAVYGNLSLNTLKKVLNRAKKSRKFKVEALVRILETRLDTCLYRMNLFVSFASLRQLINHGYIYVNNKRVTKPGYCLSFGDIVSLSPRSKQILKPGFRARLKTNSFKIRIAKKKTKLRLRKAPRRAGAELVTISSRAKRLRASSLKFGPIFFWQLLSAKFMILDLEKMRFHKSRKSKKAHLEAKAFRIQQSRGAIFPNSVLSAIKQEVSKRVYTKFMSSFPHNRIPSSRYSLEAQLYVIKSVLDQKPMILGLNPLSLPHNGLFQELGLAHGSKTILKIPANLLPGIVSDSIRRIDVGMSEELAKQYKPNSPRDGFVYFPNTGNFPFPMLINQSLFLSAYLKTLGLSNHPLRALRLEFLWDCFLFELKTRKQWKEISKGVSTAHDRSPKTLRPIGELRQRVLNLLRSKKSLGNRHVAGEWAIVPSLREQTSKETSNRQMRTRVLKPKRFQKKTLSSLKSKSNSWQKEKFSAWIQEFRRRRRRTNSGSFRGQRKRSIPKWAPIKPNHLEISYKLFTLVFLFPPQEIFLPVSLDFPRAMRAIKIQH